jgi:DNA-binding PadR family transcriptional regulator
MLSKELVAASTVPLVLSVLSEGESYGYEIIRKVKDLSGGQIEWSEGMLYPVLHWMENEGMIQAQWKEGESGRKRKYYFIQEPGRQTLVRERQQWMTVHATLTKLWIPQANSI